MKALVIRMAKAFLGLISFWIIFSATNPFFNRVKVKTGNDIISFNLNHVTITKKKLVTEVFIPRKNQTLIFISEVKFLNLRNREIYSEEVFSRCNSELQFLRGPFKIKEPVGEFDLEKKYEP